MNIFKPSSIEEYIIFILQTGSYSGIELLNKIRISRPRTTKQALYAALKKLKIEEIVTMHHMRISLSSVWVNKMTDFFQKANQLYLKSVVLDQGFLNLEDGDRITYAFKSPHTADVFWGHAFNVLSDITSLSEPVYNYNPHEWFMLARKESEQALFNKLVLNGKRICLLSGGNTFLDKLVSREFDGNMAQYHSTDSNDFEKRNYYFNIFNDYIIEAYLDDETVRNIDDFYNRTTQWNKETSEELVKIISSEGKNKIAISKNHRKAQRLKRVFKKYFHISTA